ncbi:MAG: glycosyltransferase family 2 protein [Bacteroidales bacterium]|nr:glycosyltransferase family 2 protein [Bacteroidales bacterium]
MPSFGNVYIILVNWNRPQDTLECVRSINKSNYLDYKIIVVDNGSSDNSIRLIEDEGGDLVLLQSKENLGFTGGNNLGIEYALEQNADYIFLLNNDTIVAADGILKMLEVMNSDSNIGIVSPKILFYDRPDIIWFGGATFNEYFIIGRMNGYGSKDDSLYNKQDDIPFASGCAMLIRRKVIENTGVLCNDFFAVMEDIEFSLRVRNNGYKIKYVPSSLVYHKESITAGGHDAPQYVYYQTRNTFVLRRHLGKINRFHILSHIFSITYFLKRVLKFISRRKWRSILGIIFGVVDGITGKLGKHERALLAGPNKKLENFK